MKPTKMRNKQIYRALNQDVNKQICAPLSKDLRKKYSRRSARIMVDDTVNVIRGEYKGIKGKVSKISTTNNSIAIEGNKKEKLKGDKIDVYIHSSNVIITSLNTGDKWRLKILEKKPKSKIKSMKDDAKSLGADAVINVRITTSMIMQGCSEIMAYGTAVKLS